MAEQSTKFAILNWWHKWEDQQLVICCNTDTPCHLWLAFTWTPTRLHMRQDFQRGYGFHWYPKFCFVEYTWQEQIQHGDTLEHTFIPYGGEPGLWCAFAFVAYVNTTLCFSKIGFIKAKFDQQGEAPELTPPTLYDAIKYLPWQENVFDIAQIELAAWPLEYMTSTAAIRKSPNHIYLANGADPLSVARTYIGSFGNSYFRPAIKSQLRIVVFVSTVDSGTAVQMMHGNFLSGSGYGFWLNQTTLLGRLRAPRGSVDETLLLNVQSGVPYLLEAKFTPPNKCEWWINGVWVATRILYEDMGSDQTFHWRFVNAWNANSVCACERIMVWQQSIYTGEYHNGS